MKEPKFTYKIKGEVVSLEVWKAYQTKLIELSKEFEIRRAEITRRHLERAEGEKRDGK